MERFGWIVVYLEKTINFADVNRLQKPDRVRAAGCRHNEKRLLTLFLGSWKLRKFLRLVKNEANSRCLVDMIYLRAISARVLMPLYLYHICVRLLYVCSFN